MKLVKSLLLGTAAGFAAMSGAQAADLPSRKAAPVEFVRVCSAYGAGFFFIPGTETCLRVGGRIRAEYAVTQRFNGLAGTQDQDGYGFRTRGRLNIDARTQTAYGTLRTFIRFEMTVSNGFYGAGNGGFGSSHSGGSSFSGGRGGAGATVAALDKGFIQFGPITAGRAQSFFDAYADDLNYGVIRGSDLANNLLAYTATFGGGFSATISLEDRSEREVTGGTPIGGQTYPDIVAALNVTQGWGSFQLSGVLTQRNAFAIGVSDKTGFAIQAAAKINLPMLAAGDYLWLQAAYAEGAISYLGYGGRGDTSTWNQASRAGRFVFQNVDSSTVVVGGIASQKLTKGYALTAGLLHYWTPQIRQGIYASYSKLDYNALVSTVDPRELRIGSNLIWSPVAGLDIGVEVLYAKVSGSTPIAALGVPVARTIKSDDAWQGRLRIQRDF